MLSNFLALCHPPFPHRMSFSCTGPPCSTFPIGTDMAAAAGQGGSEMAMAAEVVGDVEGACSEHETDGFGFESPISDMVVEGTMPERCERCCLWQ
jgi:hypothetical protein